MDTLYQPFNRPYPIYKDHIAAQEAAAGKAERRAAAAASVQPHLPSRPDIIEAVPACLQSKYACTSA